MKVLIISIFLCFYVSVSWAQWGGLLTHTDIHKGDVWCMVNDDAGDPWGINNVYTMCLKILDVKSGWVIYVHAENVEPFEDACRDCEMNKHAKRISDFSTYGYVKAWGE